MVLGLLAGLSARIRQELEVVQQVVGPIFKLLLMIRSMAFKNGSLRVCCFRSVAMRTWFCKSSSGSLWEDDSASSVSLLPEAPLSLSSQNKCSKFMYMHKLIYWRKGPQHPPVGWFRSISRFRHIPVPEQFFFHDHFGAPIQTFSFLSVSTYYRLLVSLPTFNLA